MKEFPFSPVLPPVAVNGRRRLPLRFERARGLTPRRLNWLVNKFRAGAFTVLPLLLLLSVVDAPAGAETLGREPALSRSFDEPRLQWGPCPAFMPAGCGLAVLHGDTGKPNADVFLKVLPNSTIPEHWHTSAERMILVSGELHVTYEGQATLILKPGMYAYGPAKALHKASCIGTDTCVLFIAFESSVDAVPVGQLK